MPGQPGGKSEPVFVLHAHAEVEDLPSLSTRVAPYETTEGERALLSKHGFLSAGTDMPRQTANLPVFPLLTAFWDYPEGLGFFLASKSSIAFRPWATGTCFCWDLRDLTVLCCSLLLSIFNILTEKPNHFQMSSLSGRSYPPVKTHHTPPQLDKFWPCDSGCDKHPEREREKMDTCMQSFRCLCRVYHCFGRSSLPCFTYLEWAMEVFSLTAHGAVCF